MRRIIGDPVPTIGWRCYFYINTHISHQVSADPASLLAREELPCAPPSTRNAPPVHSIGLQAVPTLSCRAWRREALAVFWVITRRQLQSTLVADRVVPRLTRWPEALHNFQPLPHNVFCWCPHNNPTSRRESPRPSPRPFAIMPPPYPPKSPTSK